MDFRKIATEIMLHAGDEKWYETRERIEKALRDASAGAGGNAPRRFDSAEVAPGWLPGSTPGASLHFSIDHWRDQPDGVR